MRHAVWVILTDGSILEGWMPTSQLKMALRGERVQEWDTFRMVIDKRHGIQEDTLFDIKDILVELRWGVLS